MKKQCLLCLNFCFGALSVYNKHRLTVKQTTRVKDRHNSYPCRASAFASSSPFWGVSSLSKHLPVALMGTAKLFLDPSLSTGGNCRKSPQTLMASPPNLREGFCLACRMRTSHWRNWLDAIMETSSKYCLGTANKDFLALELFWSSLTVTCTSGPGKYFFQLLPYRSAFEFRLILKTLGQL